MHERDSKRKVCHAFQLLWALPPDPVLPINPAGGLVDLATFFVI